jgi:hypothetical protein
MQDAIGCLLAIYCDLLARLSGGRWANDFNGLKLRVWSAGVSKCTGFQRLASSDQIEVKSAVQHD